MMAVNISTAPASKMEIIFTDIVAVSSSDFHWNTFFLCEPFAPLRLCVRCSFRFCSFSDIAAVQTRCLRYILGGMAFV
jgi:hypothetical protein